jgi:hypothetical protein
VEDVDLEHQTISIHKQADRENGGTKATKTKRVCVVGIEPALLPLVRLLVRRQGRGASCFACPPTRSRRGVQAPRALLRRREPRAHEVSQP